MSWLARAVRLAPGDPRIVLDLARVRLGGGLADVRLAVEALEGLAGRHDVLAVWVALAMGRQILLECRLGDEKFMDFMGKQRLVFAQHFG